MAELEIRQPEESIYSNVAILMNDTDIFLIFVIEF